MLQISAPDMLGVLGDAAAYLLPEDFVALVELHDVLCDELSVLKRRHGEENDDMFFAASHNLSP